MINNTLEQISTMPLVAILRGVKPEEVVTISDILVDAGFVFMEVTLNTPEWQKSLALIKQRHGKNIVLGAGTVLSVHDVDQVSELGGQAIISPNMNIEVIKRTKQLGMISIPGCYTPTECFQAIEAGADILKIFPAETLGVEFIKAISAVLPEGAKICPTGGVTTSNMADFIHAGVFAMGIGSGIYKPGKTTAEITQSATTFVETYKRIFIQW